MSAVPPVAIGPTTPANPWVRWLAIGCGGLLLLAAAFAAIMFMTVKRATAAPEAVVHAFLAAAGRGDAAAAHAFFSAPLKEAQPLAEFAHALAAQRSLFQVADTTFTERSVDLAGAQLKGKVKLASGTELPASFKLVRENGTWKLLGYHIGGS